MEFNKKVDKLKCELHDVHVAIEELVKTNAGLKEELPRVNNECVNSFRRITLHFKFNILFFIRIL